MRLASASQGVGPVWVGLRLYPQTGLYQRGPSRPRNSVRLWDESPSRGGGSCWGARVQLSLFFSCCTSGWGWHPVSGPLVLQMASLTTQRPTELRPAYRNRVGVLIRGRTLFSLTGVLKKFPQWSTVW
jgi:hypothetical protein